MGERIVQHRVTVPFSGPGAGTAPLSWGQKTILQDMRNSDWSYNISGAHHLPAGLTVADVAERLSRLMGKHPALRTRLGTDDDGKPCQVVHGSGEIDLEVMTFADHLDRADAVDHGNRLWLKWMAAPLAEHTPWPLRMGVMQYRGEAVYLVLTLGHLVVDGVGGLLLMTDLDLGELVGRPVDPDAVRLADLARREATPELRRVSDRAMRYWEGHLRSLPPLTFGESGAPDYEAGRRCRNVRFESRAAYLAVVEIARRTRTDTGRVLLAVIAAAIARTTGVNPLTLHVAAGNRYRPGLADVIGSVVQNAVLTLDLDGTVDDVIAQARRATTAALMNSYYDPDQLAELAARLDAERGYPARITCRINDRRFSTRTRADAVADAAPLTEDEIRARLPETYLKWHKFVYRWTDQLFVNIEDHSDTVYLQVVSDTEIFPAEQVEAMLRLVEELAIEAAFRADVPTGTRREPAETTAGPR
ncbi:condensation domain-containing protein [Saccharothrix texasensis]|uniref:Condensation domain-containing protein n=1 Tax=Saccharothrix texasensis TaxID=103734 RepID=A0A3N1GXX8_9PSEU|nr:condensation domain-containing protein [Saccharothrix texasensis]ROP35019.1 condensation domain-containing protein [Saccharothrix texasensis]